MSSISWNPWHGCHKVSSGCKNCYVYYLDSQRDRDSNTIKKNKTSFNLPIQKYRNGKYKIPAGSVVNTCFTSDFFIEEADEWRSEVWDIIKKRSDLFFLIPTKRVFRIADSLPPDWDEGYENVAIAVTAEDQKQADSRIPILMELPIKHKEVFICPILEYVDVTKYISQDTFELISVGGESYEGARACDFEWIKKIKKDCDQYRTPFVFHQTGSHLIVNDKTFNIPREQEYTQAKKALKYLN